MKTTRNDEYALSNYRTKELVMRGGCYNVLTMEARKRNCLAGNDHWGVVIVSKVVAA